MAKRRKKNGGELLDLALPAAALLASFFVFRPKASAQGTKQAPAQPGTPQGPAQPGTPQGPAQSGPLTAAGLERVVAIARRENDSRIREVGGNTDKGPRIEDFQHFVGDYKNLAWCMAFVQFCVAEALGLSRKPNWGGGSCSGVYGNVRKALSAGYLDPKYNAFENDPDKRTKVKPGWVWIKEGHTGLVVGNQGDKPNSFRTIEGNTSVSGKGYGVFEQSRDWDKSSNVAWFDPIAMQEAWLRMKANA
jgi:hypothetical protein